MPQDYSSNAVVEENPVYARRAPVTRFQTEAERLEDEQNLAQYEAQQVISSQAMVEPIEPEATTEPDVIGQLAAIMRPLNLSEEQFFSLFHQAYSQAKQ